MNNSEMFDKACPEPTAPSSMRIDKLKDGGYVVGSVGVGGTFATGSIGQALDYIRTTLDPQPVAKAEDLLKVKPGGVIPVSKSDGEFRVGLRRFVCDHGCAALCEPCRDAFAKRVG